MLRLLPWISRDSQCYGYSHIHQCSKSLTGFDQARASFVRCNTKLSLQVELSALVLSGRSIPLIQERGLASLVQLKNDLAPVVRPFLSSFTQLAINLADTRRDPGDLWRE